MGPTRVVFAEPEAKAAPNRAREGASPPPPQGAGVLGGFGGFLMGEAWRRRAGRVEDAGRAAACSRPRCLAHPLLPEGFRGQFVLAELGREQFNGPG